MADTGEALSNQSSKLNLNFTLLVHGSDVACKLHLFVCTGKYLKYKLERWLRGKAHKSENLSLVTKTCVKYGRVWREEMEGHVILLLQKIRENHF